MRERERARERERTREGDIEYAIRYEGGGGSMRETRSVRLLLCLWERETVYECERERAQRRASKEENEREREGQHGETKRIRKCGEKTD